MRLLESKANKNEAENNRQALEILHKQSKHLIVLIIELIRQATSRFTDIEETK